MKRIIVIPARLQSARLPEKLLLAETGRPLIVHAIERAHEVSGVDRVIVAADGEAIARAIDPFEYEVRLTDPSLPSGTDRVGVAIDELGVPDEAVVVNLQGDEPEIEPESIERLFRTLEDADVDGMKDEGRARADVGTLVVAGSADELSDPNRVKVAKTDDDFALYFSRAPIPFDRSNSGPPERWWRHVGIYAFRPPALRAFRQAEPTVLEQTERLEQLRFLELGFRIRVGIVSGAAAGIDTRPDYDAFLSRFASGSAG